MLSRKIKYNKVNINIDAVIYTLKIVYSFYYFWEQIAISVLLIWSKKKT